MGKQRWEEWRRRRKEVRRWEKRKSEKKEDAGARKGRKVAILYVFPMIWGSGGSKSRLAKAAGAEPLSQMRDEKLHCFVWSTCPSQNAQSTFTDHFWKFRCRKSARRCGAKHLSKSKVSKTEAFATFLEVLMSKKCTPLWREAHFQVNMSMCKTQHVQRTFWSWEVESVDAVLARSIFPSKNVRNATCTVHFLTFRCRKSARRCGAKRMSKSIVSKIDGFGPLLDVQISFSVARARDCAPCQKWARREGFVAVGIITTTTIHYTTHHYTALHYTTLHNTLLQYTTPHYVTLQYTTLRSSTPHCITLHHTTQHYTTLHYITFHYATRTTLHSTSLHYTTHTTTTTTTTATTTSTTTKQHYNYNYKYNYTTLHLLQYTALQYIPLRYAPLHYTTLHLTTLHCTQLHSTTLRYTTLTTTTTPTTATTTAATALH